jgi:hypothetical protein
MQLVVMYTQNTSNSGEGKCYGILASPWEGPEGQVHEQ